MLSCKQGGHVSATGKYITSAVICLERGDVILDSEKGNNTGSGRIDPGDIFNEAGNSKAGDNKHTG